LIDILRKSGEPTAFQNKVAQDQVTYFPHLKSTPLAATLPYHWKPVGPMAQRCYLLPLALCKNTQKYLYSRLQHGDVSWIRGVTKGGGAPKSPNNVTSTEWPVSNMGAPNLLYALGAI